MVQRKREPKLDTRGAREKLQRSGKPYYRTLRQGLHLGYRKGKVSARWVVRAYVGNGRYIVQTLADADDAIEADARDVLNYTQAQRAAELAQQRFTGGRAFQGPYSVNEALEDYFSRLENEGKRTAYARGRANAHIRNGIGAKHADGITAEEIRSWMKGMADSPGRVRPKADATEPAFRKTAGPVNPRARRSSANRVLTILKAALNLAWREGRIHDDKAWRSVKPFPNVDAARARYLQITEAQRVINASEAGFRLLVQAALQTGCRYGELCALKVADFNIDAGTIAVHQSKSGKGRHVVLTDEGSAFFSDLCAGRPGAEVMLKNVARLERGRIHLERSAVQPSEPEEVQPDSGEWRTSEQVRAMASACSIAGISPPATFHALRHTWASHSVMAGVPLMIVARNLGHADTRMVERHYGHLAPSFVADAIRKGAPRFSALPPTNVVAYGTRK